MRERTEAPSLRLWPPPSSSCFFLSAVSAALATTSSPAAGAPPLSPSPGIPVSLALRLLRALYGPSPPPCSGTTSAAASSFSSSLRLSSSCPRRWRPQHRGCMIRLQSSMSNHIPVSSGLFFRVFASPVLLSLSSSPPCLPVCSPALRASRSQGAAGREGRQTSPGTRLSFPPSVLRYKLQRASGRPFLLLSCGCPRLAPFSFHSSWPARSAGPAVVGRCGTWQARRRGRRRG